MLRQLAMLLLVCLLSAGCRQNPYMDAYIELMNAERRGLEDLVVDLEYDLQKTKRELAACRGEDPDDATATNASPDRASNGDDNFDPETLEPPSIVIPGLDDEDGPNLEPPRIEEPDPITFHPSAPAVPDDDALDAPPISIRDGSAPPSGNGRSAASPVRAPSVVIQSGIRSIDEPADESTAPQNTPPKTVLNRWTPRSSTVSSTRVKRSQPISRTTSSAEKADDLQDEKLGQTAGEAKSGEKETEVSTSTSPEKPTWQPYR